jgi:chromosome segregation ATPase
MNDTRDAYVEKMKAKLDEWNADIAKLEARARQKETDAQKRYQERIASIKEKRNAVEEDLDKLRRAGSDAWEDLKTGFEMAADSLGEALRSARSRF